MFIVNPNLDDIGEENQHIRNHKTEGRCDNIGLIESKDGRYCYEQLDEKHIEWNIIVMNYIISCLKYALYYSYYNDLFFP